MGKTLLMNHVGCYFECKYTIQTSFRGRSDKFYTQIAFDILDAGFLSWLHVKRTCSQRIQKHQKWMMVTMYIIKKKLFQANNLQGWWSLCMHQNPVCRCMFALCTELSTKLFSYSQNFFIIGLLTTNQVRMHIWRGYRKLFGYINVKTNGIKHILNW